MPIRARVPIGSVSDPDFSSGSGQGLESLPNSIFVTNVLNKLGNGLVSYATN